MAVMLYIAQGIFELTDGIFQLRIYCPFTGCMKEQGKSLAFKLMK
jgi:hypothetical protein